MDLLREQPDFEGDPTHLHIILSALEDRNVSLWNQWRDEHSKTIPQLSGIYLNETDLAGIDFSGADLSHASFHDANFHKADMHNADLRGVDFEKATLTQVNLHNSFIYSANLIHTDLSSALLDGADISTSMLMCTNLSHAKFTGIIVHETDFIDCIFDSIVCRYVFLDQQRERRYPEKRDFEEGELAKLLERSRRIEG